MLAFLSNAPEGYDRVMGSEQNRARSRWTGPVVFVLCLVFPVLYVLGFGPAMWLYKQGYVTQSGVNAVYRPVILAYREVPWVHDCLSAYLKLWNS